MRLEGMHVKDGDEVNHSNCLDHKLENNITTLITDEAIDKNVKGAIRILSSYSLQIVRGDLNEQSERSRKPSSVFSMIRQGTEGKETAMSPCTLMPDR